MKTYNFMNTTKKSNLNIVNMKFPFMKINEWQGLSIYK